ncbi:MAG: hypothetical protein ABIA74_04800 [bacterium]
MRIIKFFFIVSLFLFFNSEKLFTGEFSKASKVDELKKTGSFKKADGSEDVARKKQQVVEELKVKLGTKKPEVPPTVSPSPIAGKIPELPKYEPKEAPEKVSTVESEKKPTGLYTTLKETVKKVLGLTEEQKKLKAEKAKEKAKEQLKKEQEKASLELREKGTIGGLAPKFAGEGLKKEVSEAEKQGIEQEARKIAGKERIKYETGRTLLSKLGIPDDQKNKVMNIFTQERDYNLAREKGVTGEDVSELNNLRKKTESSVDGLVEAEEDYRKGEEEYRKAKSESERADEASKMAEDNLKIGYELFSDGSEESNKKLSEFEIESSKREIESSRQSDILREKTNDFEEAKKRRESAQKEKNDAFERAVKREEELFGKLEKEGVVYEKDDFEKFIKNVNEVFIKRQTGEQEDVEKLYQSISKQNELTENIKNLNSDLEKEGLSSKDKSKINKEIKTLENNLEKERKNTQSLIDGLEKTALEIEEIEREQAKVLEEEVAKGLTESKKREERLIGSLKQLPEKSVEDVWKEQMKKEMEEEETWE